MIHIIVILWTIIISSVSVGLFLLKHEVQALEDELSRINYDIRATRESIHILKAEWNLLNDPNRLRRLAEQHLGMNILKPEQITLVDALPSFFEKLEHSKVVINPEKKQAKIPRISSSNRNTLRVSPHFKIPTF